MVEVPYYNTIQPRNGSGLFHSSQGHCLNENHCGRDLDILILRCTNISSVSLSMFRSPLGT